MNGRPWTIALICIAGGALFFASLPTLWPLARTDLVASPNDLRSQARSFLEGRGFDLTGYRSARQLVVHTAPLDYVDRELGRERAQSQITAGLPLVYYRATFKKPGEVVWYSVGVHPERGIVGWTKSVPEDYAGARISIAVARELAREALSGGLGLDPAELRERSASTSEQEERRTHSIGYERTISEEPKLDERISITVSGDEVTAAVRRLRVPDEASRKARAREAPGVALETFGFALLAALIVGAFLVFLVRLQRGSVVLRRAALWPGIVFFCLLATYALETASLFGYWEPLWPQWVSNLRYLVLRAVQQAWLLVLLLAVVAAGDALDRELGAGRGSSLWTLGRGGFLDPAVARASGNGFLVGLLCGGAMAGAVILLQTVAGAVTSIQPRGFFFYTLNSASPAATSLLFFLGVALAEELGYRFFAGSWLLKLTGRRWLAVLAPAIVYGLAHTRLDFLPPAEPFWGRAFVLTAVGCVWGWAFFRYDALTVVLSHFTADLFIFNWPRLASGEPAAVAVSVATICVPLLPFLIARVRARVRFASG